MTFKVCIAWAISAVALLISSAIASSSENGSSSLTLPIEDVASTDDSSLEGDDQNDDAEEIED